MVVKPDLDSLVIELVQWLKTQPQLPQVIATEKALLARFLYTMYGDLEGAKRLIGLNYALRSKFSQIFLERDPTDASAQQLLQVADLLPLPGLTPQRNKLLFYRLSDHDADKFDFTASIKVFFMVADCRFAFEDEAMSDGEIPIFDMDGFSLRHLRKTVFSSLRAYMKFVQEAHPVRLREIHVLNCPSYLDKVLTVVRPFIKSEVFKLIRFHLPNADTPYEYFPRDMLPDEYGGKAGKLCTLREKWLKILVEKRDYLMDPNRWKIDLTKKPTDITTTTPLATTTATTTTMATTKNRNLCENFRTLEID